ncbi:ComEC/Rec2 family competence protein [Marisediminicola sp. LYQ134]|uniref:ComEC/Rec2 family competence protein n=1 Tax=Marisediminicola sp. LYQ134 TaxID=3391061 RepID=UPI003983BE5E
MRGDARLAVPAAVAWVTTAVSIGAPSALAVVAVVAFGAAGAGAATVLILRSGRRRGVLAVVTLAAAATGLIVTSAVATAPHRSPEPLEAAAREGRFVSLVVTSEEELVGASTSWLATATRADIGAESTIVRVPVRIVGGVVAPSTDGGDRVALGSTLEVQGTLMSTDPADATPFVVFAPGESRVLTRPEGMLAATSALRAGFHDLAIALPGDGGALLPGLSIGDTSAVDDTLDGAMKSSSLSHLTAVSGANCAIVVGLVMAIAGAARAPMLARIALAVVALGGFVILVTPEPSVLRASVMAVTVLLGITSGRASRGLPVLALAVIVLLTLDPWLARDFGFVLSVLATAGLLVVAAPVSDVLSTVMPRALAVVLAVPIAAQLACQPVLILLEPSIPVLGVLANVLAAPAAPVATIVGLAACLLEPVIPAVATGLAWIAWVPAAWIAAVATAVAASPFATVEWTPGPTGALALAGVTLVGLLGVLALRSERRRIRFAGVAVLSVCVVVGSTSGVTSRVLEHVDRPHDWTIAACDVGQGDAMVVRNGGEVALIDTGADPLLLDACLGDLGIDTIDLLVLTHFDLDHVGGVPAVIGRAARVLTGPPDDDAEALLLDLRRGGADVDEVRAGQTGTLGEQTWGVLWPPSRAQTPAGNDASLVIHWNGDCATCASALFLGDLGEESQRRLLGANAITPVDVVKVAHHGSSDQSAELYDTLAAALALIGVGENDYGHPSRRSLDIVESTGGTVARTDRHGLVLVTKQRDGRLTVWSERASGSDDVGDAD